MRRSSSLSCSGRPLWLWLTSASRMTWVPARTWPSRLRALRQNGRASKTTPTTSTRANGKAVGRKGWVSATSGAPAANRMASSSVARRARRGASARSTPLPVAGKAPSASRRPRRRAVRRAPQKNGRAKAMAARVTSTPAKVGDKRPESTLPSRPRPSDEAMTKPAMMATSRTRKPARRRIRLHSERRWRASPSFLVQEP